MVPFGVLAVLTAAKKYNIVLELYIKEANLRNNTMNRKKQTRPINLQNVSCFQDVEIPGLKKARRTETFLGARSRNSRCKLS